VALVWALMTGSKYGYSLLGLCLFVQLFSGGVLLHNHSNLSYYYYIINQKRTVGDSLSFAYDLVNNSLIPIPFVSVQMDLSRDLTRMELTEEGFYFKSLQLFKRNMEVPCSRRGHYKLGKMHARIKDPFGFFEIDKTFERTIDLMIYPKRYDLDAIQITPSELFGSVQMDSPVYEDYTNIKDIRSYQNGDTFKNVHWKLSAKMNQLMMKTYELNANPKIHLVLDGCHAAYKEDTDHLIEEALVSIATSICYFTLQKNIETTLESSFKRDNQVTYRKSKSIQMYPSFLSDLVYFRPLGATAMSQFIFHESRKWHYGTRLVLLTPNPSHKLIDDLAPLRMRKIKVSIITISQSQETIQDLINYGLAMGVDLYPAPLNKIDQLWEAIG